MEKKGIKGTTAGINGISIGIIVGGLLAFCIILYFVTTGQASGFDDSVRQVIYSLRTAGLNTLMEGITYLGNWQSIVMLCLLFLAYDKTRMAYGIPVASIALVETGLNKVIKTVIERGRPDDVMHLINQSGYAFPSGHSAASMAVYGLLLYLVQTRMENKKTAKSLSVLLVFLIASIGFSRIYLGVHYPTDVLGGWMEGLVLLGIAVLVLGRFNNEDRKPDVETNPN